MKIKILKAGRGDCFIVEGEKDYILIDGGTGLTLAEIKRKIDFNKKITIFITHYDSDHIAGVLNFLRSMDGALPSIAVYINLPEEYLVSHGGLVSNGQAKKLTLFFRPCDSIDSAIFGDEIKINDISILILNPSADVYKNLSENFKIFVSDLSNKTSMKVAAPGPKIIDFSTIGNVVLDAKASNADLHNRSSISKIVSIEHKKTLFLGDSHACDIIHALKLQGYSESNPLDCDLVKISHHGSKHNTSNELLRYVKCNKYIVSTSGAGGYYHPDVEVIKIILNQCVIYGFNECTFYFNYENVKNSIKINNVPEWFKVNLICEEDIYI